MTSLESGIASLPERKDDDEDGIHVPIRIAARNVARDEPDTRGQLPRADLLWKINPHRHADETAAGGVRIPAAIPAVNGATGPRISIL